MSNWIELTQDCLPAKGEKVDLWMVSVSDATKQYRQTWTWEGDSKDGQLTISGYKATHWMPFPKPPKN